MIISKRICTTMPMPLSNAGPMRRFSILLFSLLLGTFPAVSRVGQESTLISTQKTEFISAQNALPIPTQAEEVSLLAEISEIGQMLSTLQVPLRSSPGYNRIASPTTVSTLSQTVSAFQWLKQDCDPCGPSPGGASLLCGNAYARNTSVAF
jgi:hypothetical protein